LFILLDIEVADGFATQDANETRINNMLDQVLDGVIDLKELATAMGTQIQQTDAVIDNLDNQVGAANVHLDTLNTKLKVKSKNICFAFITLS
jgi:hypothetical protein